MSLVKENWKQSREIIRLKEIERQAAEVVRATDNRWLDEPISVAIDRLRELMEAQPAKGGTV